MITINLRDTGAEVKVTRDGRTTTKLVDLADIQNIFKENTEYDSGDLGLIGKGAMGIKRIISRGNKHCVMVHAIDPIIDVAFTGVSKKIENVYHPSLIMGIFLEKDDERYYVDADKTCLLAARNMILTPEDQLYYFPFSNVYTDSMGKVCWGNNRLPELDNIAQSIGILQMFLYSVMNYDLYHAPVIKKGGVYDQGNGRCEDVLKLLKELSSQHKKLDSFPYDEIKLHTKTSYKDFVAYCKGRL